MKIKLGKYFFIIKKLNISKIDKKIKLNKSNVLKNINFNFIFVVIYFSKIQNLKKCKYIFKIFNIFFFQDFFFK